MNDAGHNTHLPGGVSNPLLGRNGTGTGSGSGANHAGTATHPPSTSQAHLDYHTLPSDAELDQFASSIYPQYALDVSGAGTEQSAFYDDVSAPPAHLSDVNSFPTSLHNGGTPVGGRADQFHYNNNSDNPEDLDYFTYSSFSVPSSRIDHLYPSVPTNQGQYYDSQNQVQTRSDQYDNFLQPQKMLQPQHSGASQESHLKRRLSGSHQQIPLTPPVAKAKSVKMLQKPSKPQKPKAIRQNSFPIVSKSKVTKPYPQFHESITPSHDSSNIQQSYFDLDRRTDSGAVSGTSTPVTEPTTNNDNEDNYAAYANKQFRDTTPTSSAHAKASPRPRGRPKNSKNPGFFIKLDNINRVAPKSMATTHSNSSVDSLFHNKPLVSSKQFSALPIYKDDDDSVRQDLRILEPDIEGSELQRFASANSNMTPSMKPPGTSQNSYFEVDSGLANSAFLSPHINYNENTYNNFSKGFEQYLVEPKVETYTENHPDLSGYNFDVNPNEMLPSPSDLFKPIGLDSIDQNDNRAGALLDPLNIQGDTNIQTHIKADEDEANHSLDEYLSHGEHSRTSDQENEISHAYSQNQAFSPSSASSSDLHPLERTSSANSVSSRDNATSENDTKPKKKRNPKGAICSICNKHISRDLTRHLRIHNEVGRFQCVYPKEMCNHKTQHFNRPYDYKKHLLHVHFKFDDPKGKLSHTLTDKLPLPGTCVACGTRFRAKDWLDSHVLTDNNAQRCPHLAGAHIKQDY